MACWLVIQSRRCKGRRWFVSLGSHPAGASARYPRRSPRIPRASGAEALSGLARAFFYAQARALLVSHWEVDLVATVKLIVSTVGATARDFKLGRAEALRRAMLTLIDKGEPHELHPAYWAPFVVVGEGSGEVPAQSVFSITRPEAPPTKTKERQPTRPATKSEAPGWETEVSRH